ncbi:response regulator [Candidatus Peregrinibacteria bacterium]|nr:response regulator [Candidatus Peregrinibacteria bacterium]
MTLKQNSTFRQKKIEKEVPPEQMKRVLLVEDDEATRKICKNLFEDHGFHVEISDEGMEGMMKVSEFQPHVVIFDILTPILGGYEFLESVRSNSGEDILIVVYTRLASDDEAIKGFVQGADEFFRKPEVSPEGLVKKVRKILQKKAEGDEE